MNRRYGMTFNCSTVTKCTVVEKKRRVTRLLEVTNKAIRGVEGAEGAGCTEVYTAKLWTVFGSNKTSATIVTFQLAS
jgi:chaperonin GroEL (HSP60 family)